MRIMAIDYGDRRIGLAVSDLLGMLAGEAWTMQEWDRERRSSIEAHAILHAAGKKERAHRGTVDAVAASLILEGYLDSQKYTK